MFCENRITHTIKQGDTIYRLARQYHTTVPEILVRNPGVNPYNLQIGSRMVICEGRSGSITASQLDEMEVNQDLRQAWSQLSYWTRMYMLSDSSDIDDKELVADRIRRIPAEMADIFGNYYPADVTAGLQGALEIFVGDIIELVGLVKQGDAQRTDELDAKLEQEVADIANALSGLNMNYDRAKLEQELEEYLMLTKRELVARLSKEYADDIATFAELENTAMKIADYLSDGIIKQFYQK